MRFSCKKTSNSLGDLLSLQGQVAVVIGGAGLLGSQISSAFMELGADVVIASRDARNCEIVISNLKESLGGGQIRAEEVDITDEKSIDSLVSVIRKRYPSGIDILVNCGWSGKKNTFDSITDSDWEYDINVCLSGVFKTIKRMVPLLEMRKGNILNIASMYGHVAPDYRIYDGDRFANPPSYGAAKAGVIQLTRYLASFLSPKGIRVNCISPGPFPFESTQLDSPEFINRLAEKNPSNRIGDPCEIKGAAALLCSRAGGYINGHNLCVDGGWTAW